MPCLSLSGDGLAGEGSRFRAGGGRCGGYDRMVSKSKLAPETLKAQALRQIDTTTGGLTPGILPLTTCVRDGDNELIDLRRSYGRDENPGFAVAGKVLAELEGGRGGVAVQFRHVGGDGDHAVLEARRPDRGAEDHVLGPADPARADLVVHSATKYLNGRCDVVAGAVVTAREDDLWERIGQVRLHGGAIVGSFEAWLLQRGMRTLFLRVQKASESALAIARHFEGHPN